MAAKFDSVDMNAIMQEVRELTLAVVDAADKWVLFSEHGLIPKGASSDIEALLRHARILLDLGLDWSGVVREVKKILLYGDVFSKKFSADISEDMKSNEFRNALLVRLKKLEDYIYSFPSMKKDHSVALFDLNDPEHKEVDVEDAYKKLSEIEARLDHTGRQVEAMEVRLDGVGESANKVGKRVEVVVSHIAEEAKGVIERERDDIINHAKEVSMQLEMVLGEVRKMHDVSVKLTSDIGVSALSGSYAQNADIERVFADKYRVYAILGMMVAGLVLVAILAYSMSKSASYTEMLLRVSISLIFLLPIGYFARESSRHRSQAINLRKISLDLEVLTPYLENLPEPKKSELKVKLGERIFFSDQRIEMPNSYELNLQEIILKIIEAGGIKKP